MEKEIKNIVFDVGNVLIDFCWEKVCKNLGFSEEIIRTFEKNMIQSIFWDKLDEGTMTQQDAIDQFRCVMPQYEEEILKFWERAEDFVEEYDYASKIILALKKKGYNVYLLSNYPLDMYELHWPKFSFYSLVDGFVVSAVERMRKPNPEIYELLLERYHLNAGESIFIDDRQENVDAAIACGMQGILFTGCECVVQYFGIENQM